MGNGSTPSSATAVVQTICILTNACAHVCQCTCISPAPIYHVSVFIGCATAHDKRSRISVYVTRLIARALVAASRV
jgi:hypothetical protein